jgi:iron complex transport system substrate-binding protein
MERHDPDGAELLPLSGQRCGRRTALLLTAAFLAGCRRKSAPDRGGPRVVSLHDVTTEIIVELGAVDRLVGVGAPVDLSEKAALAVSQVRRVEGAETIFSVHPELILGLGVVAERDPELVNRLKRAGVGVELADPETLDDVLTLTRSIAERVGAVPAGEKIIAKLRAAISRNEPPPARPLPVFVYDCCDPPFTAGKKTVLTDLISRAGGRNVFSDLQADWTHVSWEEAVARRPELIVIHAYQHEGQGDVADKRKALSAIAALRRLPTAVMPLGCSLGGLRSIEGLERLRAAIREHS